MVELGGWWWLVILLPPLLYIQRMLHREMQEIFYLLSGRQEVALLLFSMVFFPGVLLHESSHYLMARMLGVRTAGISIWPRMMTNGRLQLGYVETAKSDILRQALIGLAPLLAGCTVVVYVGIVRLGMTSIWQPLSRLDGSAILHQMGVVYAQPDFWLWFYLLFVVSSTMFPSRSDQRAWLPLIIFVCASLGLAILAGAGDWMMANLMPTVAILFSGLASILAISLLVHIIFYAPLPVLKSILTRFLPIREL
jgi:hypothetical protein